MACLCQGTRYLTWCRRWVYWRYIKLIVNWRSSSDKQAATWRSSEVPYESRCEGEPERVCSEKIASYIAIILRQRSWQWWRRIPMINKLSWLLAEYPHLTPAQYSNSSTILQLQHNIHNKKFCNCWLITKIKCYENWHYTVNWNLIGNLQILNSHWKS